MHKIGIIEEIYQSLNKSGISIRLGGAYPIKKIKDDTFINVNAQRRIYLYFVTTRKCIIALIENCFFKG